MKNLKTASTHFLLFTVAFFSSILYGCQQQRRLVILPFTFEVNSINPGSYDATQQILTQQYPMPAGVSEIVINYTLKNQINTFPGHITATIDASPLLSSSTYPNTLPAIAANTNFTSEFHGWGFPAGKYTLTLTYWTQSSIQYLDRFGKLNYQDSVVAKADFDFVVPQGLVDVDSDLIDDATEYQLLKTFRPYYRFSLENPKNQFGVRQPKSENNPGTPDANRPIEALSFIRYSQLLTSDDESSDIAIDNHDLSLSPGHVLFDKGGANWFKGPSIITENADQMNYFIDPIPHPRTGNVEDPARVGSDWFSVTQLGNIGLYGHVVPITLLRDPNTGILNYSKDSIPRGQLDKDNLYYKIEYWQFYGFNQCYCGVANHEGDWTTVQLLYDPRKNSIESVFFYEHGENEFRYDMNQTVKTEQIDDPHLAGHFMQFEGVNFGKIGDDNEVFEANVKEDRVQFFRDEPTQNYTHPVVYIEVGAHEPWPTRVYKFPIQPNHDGDDYEHCFLTATPPNLGEVEHPMQWDGAKEIVNFNGNWGANNGGARGPCTHTEWTWPSSSSVRWQIHSLSN